MHDLLLPMDGSWSRGLARARLMVDKDAFQTYVNACEDVIFWYDSNVIVQDPIDRDVYMEAYRQIYGGPHVRTLYGPNEPPGKIVTLSFLKDQYNLEQMRVLSKHDVIILCSTGRQKALEGRVLLSNPQDACKGSQYSGPYSTASSRTPILDQCTLSDLSVLVVRALSLDESSTSYNWESDPTVSCIYI